MDGKDDSGENIKRQLYVSEDVQDVDNNFIHNGCLMSGITGVPHISNYISTCRPFIHWTRAGIQLVARVSGIHRNEYSYIDVGIKLLPIVLIGKFIFHNFLIPTQLLHI